MTGRIRTVRAGALQGLGAWLAYAILECLAACLIPLATGRYGVMSPWGWRTEAILVASYALAGLMLGAVAGFILGGRATDDVRTVRAAGTLTLVFGFIVNLASTRGIPKSQYAPLAIALLLSAILMAGLCLPTWRHRTRVLSNSWLVGSLLLVAPLLTRAMPSGNSSIVRVGVVGLVMALVGGAVYLSRQDAVRRPPSHFRKASAAFGIVLVPVFLFFLSRLPPRVRADSPQATGRYNVVMIVMDTVRADHLSL